MRLTQLFAIPSIFAMLLLGSCEATQTDDQSDCVKVAELAQKCLHKAREQTQEEIVADCEYGLREKEMWTWASIDCYRAVGEDCVKWVECIRKDPYPKDRPSTADGIDKVTSGEEGEEPEDPAATEAEKAKRAEEREARKKAREEQKAKEAAEAEAAAKEEPAEKKPTEGTLGNPSED